MQNAKCKMQNCGIACGDDLDYGVAVGTTLAVVRRHRVHRLPPPLRGTPLINEGGKGAVGSDSCEQSVKNEAWRLKSLRIDI